MVLIISKETSDIRLQATIRGWQNNLGTRESSGLETSKRILRVKSEPKEKKSPEISRRAVEKEQKEIILHCFVTAIFFFKAVPLAIIDIGYS